MATGINILVLNFF